MKKLYKKCNSIMIYLSCLLLFSTNVIAKSVGGSNDGVHGVAGREAAAKSVNEIAKLINQFSYVVFIIVAILGAIIGVWTTVKSASRERIDLAEIATTWCQIFLIVFVCGSANKIASYIASNGITI